MNIEEQNPYFLQIQALKRLKQLSEIVNIFKVHLAEHLLQKEKEIGIEISKQLKDRCMTFLSFNQKIMHKCEYCGKEFDDGRKLGGHVSKAHLKEHSAKKLKISSKSIKSIQEQPIYSETDIFAKLEDDYYRAMMDEET